MTYHVKNRTTTTYAHYEALCQVVAYASNLLIEIQKTKSTVAIQESMDLDSALRFLDAVNDDDIKPYWQKMAYSFPEGSDAARLRDES